MGINVGSLAGGPEIGREPVADVGEAVCHGFGWTEFDGAGVWSQSQNPHGAAPSPLWGEGWGEGGPSFSGSSPLTLALSPEGRGNRPGRGLHCAPFPPVPRSHPTPLRATRVTPLITNETPQT